MSFVSDLFGGDQETPDYSQAIKAAEFKPYSISTGFGSSTWDTGAQTGGYTLSPELQKFRDMYYKAAMEAAPTTSQTDFANAISKMGQDIYGRGAGVNLNQLSADYLNKQLGLLAPQRAQQNVELADTLFKTGRTGAGTGMTTVGGQTGYVNPEQFSLLAAREAANAQMGLEATDRARQQQLSDIQAGLGLYGMGQQAKVSPYSTMAQLMGYGTGVEQLGLIPLNAGITAGQAGASAGANVAQLLAQQENARVAAANDTGLFGGLLQGALSTFAPAVGKWGATQVFGNTGGWFGGKSGNASPGINLSGYSFPGFTY